eukprot:COSAG01_NODE_285_length_19434_cov_131.491777_1_plen_31_part_10
MAPWRAHKPPEDVTPGILDHEDGGSCLASQV